MEQEDKVMTTLTLWCTFLMGYIDTYSFLNYNDLLVSAQTGNMVLLGANVLKGFEEVMPHVASFIGFLGGTFLAQGLLEITDKRTKPSYNLFTLIQVLVLFFVALLETHMSIYIFAVLLSAFSGYNLTVFNKVGATKINNGIMTGNVQKFMTNMYLTLFKKSEEAKETSKIIFVGVMLFVIGIFTSALLYHYLDINMMLVAAVLSLLIYMWLLFTKKTV